MRGELQARSAARVRLDVYSDWDELDRGAETARIAELAEEKRRLEQASDELGRIAGLLDDNARRQGELETERDELQREIERLQAILADRQLLLTVVSDELAEVAREHGTPRRTVLLATTAVPVWLVGRALVATDQGTPGWAWPVAVAAVVVAGLWAAARVVEGEHGR